MPEPSVTHSTFVVERSYPHPPERVFAAFAQPSRKRRWYAEGDHEIQEFEMEFRVGGGDRLRYRFKEGHPIAGSEILNESTYQDIVPDHRIVMTQKMSMNGKAINVNLLTFEFLPSDNGTQLVLTNQGTFVDWPEGAKMVEHGWRSLVERIGAEVA